MEGRTKYQLAPASEAGPSAHYQRYTVDRGLSTAHTVNFVVEGREDALIDPAECYLKSTFRIVNADGSAVDELATVFPTANYGANLWSHVSISLNNTPLPPGNDYAYTALLSDLLGGSPNVRDGVLTDLAGWGNPSHLTSKVDVALGINPDVFEDYKAVGSMSQEVSVYHRIHSDFLQTCAQLIPNRMQLGVTLTRGNDSFVLAREASDEKDYKVEIRSVSLFVKRVLPGPLALARLNTSLERGGKLHYQRLHTVAIPCAKGSLAWSWHNCFNNVVPRRVFVALVSQESYYGSYGRVCTYLESANVRRVRFCRDGREVMAEPYDSKWVYDEKGTVRWGQCQAKAAFAGFARAIGVFATPRQQAGITYLNFVNGSTVYGLSLEEGTDGRGPAEGSLDVHLDFAEATDEPLIVLVMGEHPRTLDFDTSRNLA